MKSDLLSRRDLDFLLFEWLDVEALTKRPRFAEHSAETFDDVLDLCEQIADRVLRPAQQARRRQRAHLRRHDGDADPRGQGRRWDAFADAGLLADGHGRRARRRAAAVHRGPGRLRVVPGGQRRHRRVTPMLTMGNANLLAEYGTPGADRHASCRRCSRAGSSARWRSPSRRPARRWPTSPPAPSRSRRRHLPAVRPQDVDLRRRPRTDREHRPPGAGQDSRRPGRAPRASRCSSCPSSWSTTTARSASATTSRWPGSTTRWATAAPPTRCSTSATARSRPAAEPARSATWSARRTAASPTCST